MKFWKFNQTKIQKTSKKLMEIDKNIDFGGAGNKRTSPSNSTRKTTLCKIIFMSVRSKLVQIFSKTLPVHVRKRSYVSVHNCMNACAFYVLVLHIGVGPSTPPRPVLVRPFHLTNFALGSPLGVDIKG